jgi:ribokinase
LSKLGAGYMMKESDYVLIIGSSNIDLNIYIKRFPNHGETVTGGIFKQFFGGKGANQSVASVRSGAKTFFIGKIGMDLYGDQMVSHLKDEGINIDFISRDDQFPSGVAFILIDENGENMISVAPGANSKLNIKDINDRKDIIENANVIVVQMEIPIDTIQQIFKIASKGKGITILNPAPLKSIPIEVFINGNGKQKIIQTARDISSLGIKYIITTLGKKGCILFKSKVNEFFEIPSPKVKAVDTVGAGDCFIGVLASMLNRGENILTAVKFATIAASIAVTRKGAQESMPFFNEIQEKFNELKC